MALTPVTARLFLVVHAVVGAALVATTTHLAVWSAAYLTDRPARHRGVRIFAVTSLALYAVQILIGLVIYPTYVAEVRVPLFETHGDLRWARQLFETKEHWVALGLVPLLLATAAAFMRRPGSPAPLRPRTLFVGATATALCAWTGALVGLVVSAVRAVGAPP